MKLIIINGPCGVGKSTLAEKLHQSMPTSFLLDIDAQRRFMSQYRDYREESWELSRALGRAILKTCMELKLDVIVDKMLYDEETLDSYHVIAQEHRVDVTEMILWATKEKVMQRAEDRGWREEGLLTPEKCERFWHEIDALKEKRPQAHLIDTSELSDEEVFKEAQKLIS